MAKGSEIEQFSNLNLLRKMCIRLVVFTEEPDSVKFLHDESWCKRLNCIASC